MKLFKFPLILLVLAVQLFADPPIPTGGQLTSTSSTSNTAIATEVFNAVQATLSTLSRGTIVNIAIYAPEGGGPLVYQVSRPVYQTEGRLPPEVLENIFQGYRDPTPALTSAMRGGNMPGNCGETRLPEQIQSPQGTTLRRIGFLSFIRGGSVSQPQTYALSMCTTCNASFTNEIDFSNVLPANLAQNIASTGGRPTRYPAPTNALVQRYTLDFYRTYLGNDFNFQDPSGPNIQEVQRLAAILEERVQPNPPLSCNQRRLLRVARNARNFCSQCAGAAANFGAGFLFTAMFESIDLVAPGLGTTAGLAGIGTGLMTAPRFTVNAAAPFVAGTATESGLLAAGCSRNTSLYGGIGVAGLVGCYTAGGPVGGSVVALAYTGGLLISALGSLARAEQTQTDLIRAGVDAAKRRCWRSLLNCETSPVNCTSPSDDPDGRRLPDAFTPVAVEDLRTRLRNQYLEMIQNREAAIRRRNQRNPRPGPGNLMDPFSQLQSLNNMFLSSVNGVQNPISNAPTPPGNAQCTPNGNCSSCSNVQCLLNSPPVQQLNDDMWASTDIRSLNQQFAFLNDPNAFRNAFLEYTNQVCRPNGLPALQCDPN